MQPAGRRKFLGIVVGLGGAAVMAGLGRSFFKHRLVTNPNTPPALEGLATAYRRTWALGSEMSITALHARRAVAETAIDAALEELKLVQRELSIFDADSQVARLNSCGRLDDPHPLLLQTLQLSSDLSQQTNGAFDISVQPLWDMYAEADKAGKRPDDGQIETARRLVGWQDVDFSDQRVRLARPGMGITLNGIACGLAADRVVSALTSHGIEHALVNTDEIVSLGDKEPGRPWTAGVQHPRHPEACIAMMALDGRAVATSGDYETKFFNDYDTNHIFDPATGRSPLQLASATVACPRCIDADGLSTALFVLGPEKGMKFLAGLPRTDCLMVLKNGQVLASKGFPKA